MSETLQVTVPCRNQPSRGISQRAYIRGAKERWRVVQPWILRSTGAMCIGDRA